MRIPGRPETFALLRARSQAVIGSRRWYALNGVARSPDHFCLNGEHTEVLLLRRVNFPERV